MAHDEGTHRGKAVTRRSLLIVGAVVAGAGVAAGTGVTFFALNEGKHASNGSPPMSKSITNGHTITYEIARENGAGSIRSKRTRVPLAVVVNFSAPPPPLTSTVSTSVPPSFKSVSSPGFQTRRSLPASPET